MKPKTPEKIIRIISCNGIREMTEIRIIQAMKEYVLSLLPSDEEIDKKYPIETLENKAGWTKRTISVININNRRRRILEKTFKYQILNKLNT